MGEKVKGPFANRYCGAGDIAVCRAALWAALEAAGVDLEAAQGPDPNAWRADANARADQVPARPAAVHHALHEQADRHPAGHRVQGTPLSARGSVSRAVRFEKWQALGNDYVIVEAT